MKEGTDMTQLKTVTIPEAEELARRLMEINDDAHLVRHFYPLLLPLAGQKRTGAGLFAALTLAVTDYTTGQSSMVTVMNLRMHQFLPAFTDDPEILAAARALLAAVGLPTG
jgi:hypothetical protein